ncbi:MAG: two-component regulator propeller domain-containing protein, partial [Bacteroidota bacterium]
MNCIFWYTNCSAHTSSLATFGYSKKFLLLPRITFFVLTFLLAVQQVAAQTGKQYSFRHFSVTNGLAANTVGSIAQDADGFIWMATTNGLQRYDGNTFLTFRANAKDSTTIPSTHLYNVYTDGSKRLWLASNKQRIGIFDTKKFTFREAKIEGRKRIAPDFLLQELPDGRMIVKLEGTVYLYNPALNKFILNNQLFPLPRNWHFAEMVWDEPRKVYWIGADSGLLRYDPASGRINYRGNNPDNDPVINAFAEQRRQVGLRVDKKGNVIYAFWPPNSGNGFMYRYNRTTKQAEKINLGLYTGGYHELTGYLQQKNGRFWVYGMPFLFEWTDSKKDPFIPVTGINPELPDINFDIAYKVIEDRE